MYLLPQSYRYVLKDSLGSVVWTRDNVSPATDSADLLQAGNSVGGALVGYIQKGTGSVSRTAQDKMRDSYTVNDKGGKDDNFTDNSAAVQLVKTDGGGTAIARFQPTQAVNSTFKFASLGSTDLDGIVLDVPSGATLSLPSSSYSAYRNVNVSRQTRFLWTDLNCDYYPRPKITTQRDKTNFITAGDLRYQKLTPIAASGLRFLSVPANVSDAFSTASPTFTDARGYSYSNFPSGAWYGAFVALKRGETYRGTFGVIG